MTLSARASVPIALALQLCTACSEPLTAKNFNLPDVERVFSDPRFIEQTIGSGFQQCHNNTFTTVGGRSGIHPQLLAMALEVAATTGIGSFGTGTRQAIPRTAIINSPSDMAAQNINSIDFAGLQRHARLISWALAAIDVLERRGASFGSPAQAVRARAFGFFVLACDLGNVALMYDSAAIVSPALPNDSIPPLSSAHDVMRAALRMLDSAIVIASSPAATEAGGFPTPAHWLQNSLSRDDFVKLVRTLRARFRAGVARTPDERSAADWEAIVADAQTGIANDFVVTVGDSRGWAPGFAQFMDGSNAWQLPSFYIGMGDVSGAYDEWLATPFEDRVKPILIITPDRRLPQGSRREDQQANSPLASSYLDLPLIANRTTDITGDPFSSFYSASRYAYIRPNGGVGLLPLMTRAEMDLLMAEGSIRMNRIAEAAALIDITRVGRGGLPPLSGSVFTALDPVPGGPTCVPRVPVPPDFTSTRCGTILEAMKWEKRLETLGVGYGAWFMDSRGWGDLVESTPLEFPVPYQEMQVRHKPFYTLGGGGPSSARRGTYGFQ